MPHTQSFLKLAVLISGYGSNLQALIDATQTHLPIEICVVISNKKDAYGLKRAESAGIPTETLIREPNTPKALYEDSLRQMLERYEPQLIVLAGFMYILSTNFVNHFKHRIINIHPSLLPKYPGLNTHQQVLAAKEKTHGATVHVVTPTVDSGPIIMQATIAVSNEDDAQSLKNKVHQLEHKLYPEVIKLYAEGRLEFQDHAVYLDGKLLPKNGLKFDESR